MNVDVTASQLVAGTGSGLPQNRQIRVTSPGLIQQLSLLVMHC